jgi:MFS family permease
MSESTPLPAHELLRQQPPLRLYTPAFLLLGASHALFAASFNMILPELPAYLTSLGGAEYKGLIIALFTITAGLSRPFSGKLADSIGRLPVMYVGVAACVICGLLYPVLSTVGGFLFLRFLHGFSTGFKPTGSVAYAADVVPFARRGEAMGVLGIAMSVGGSAAPPLGSWLAQAYSVDAMFYVSAGLAALSMVILFNLTETLTEPERFRLGHLRVGRDDVFDPLAVPAGVAVLLAYFSYGALLTLVPDLSDHLGVANRGLFFTIFTLASISTRLFAGKVSDKYGRVPVLLASTVLIAAALAAFALANTPSIFYLASTLYGLGVGIFSPAITAWTVDLGDPQRRGRALATMYIALEIAIGGGALAAGWWFANDITRMPAVFWTGAGLSLLGCGYLLWWRKRN